MAANKSTETLANSQDAAGETTPLLNTSERIDHSETASIGSSHATKSPQTSEPPSPSTTQPDDEEKPFPLNQILILCYASVVEPIAYFIIFPYMTEMVERVGGGATEDVGYWVGTIESSFSLVQMLFIIFYGRIADRLGRKPVMVFSLGGIGLASALFGISTTIWQMLAFRCLAGLFSGSSVTIRSMLSENCTKKTQAKAFAWFMFARNIGLFMGPALGGFLANPATQYSALKNVAFFNSYPYALPGFLSGAFCLSASIVGIISLKETLPSKLDANGQPKPDTEMSTWELMKAPGVAIVVFIYSHVILQALCYTAITPIAQWTPVRLGGWGFSYQWISIALALAGFSQAVWMLFGFPYLQRKTSTGTVLRICCIAWPIEMALYPLLNELLRADLRPAFWTAAFTTIFLGSGIAMSFACIQLCLNDIAPSPDTLATLNAVALTINCGMRAIAPVGMASLYAVGIKGGWFDGHLGWIVLTFMGLLLNVSVRWLPAKAEGDLHHKTTPSDEEAEG